VDAGQLFRRERPELGGLGESRIGPDLDEVAALAAFHSNGLPRDLFVGDLVLRLAAITEKLHGALGVVSSVPAFA
jgi:hypothetical protein